MEHFFQPDIDERIPGQIGMSDLVAIAALVRRVPPHGIVVESGSLYGRSSYVWARNCDPTVKVFCIDPWEREHWIVEIVEKPQRISRAFSLEAFRYYTRECPNIIPIRGKSPDVVKGSWSVPIDIYFDDSDHSDPALSNNYDFWIPFVKPGGIVAGDDYGDHAPDVMRFADELAHRWTQPLGRARYLWWLVKPAA